MGYAHVGHLHGLFALLRLEAYVEVALEHLFVVSELVAQGLRAAQLIGDDGGVALHLLALEGGLLPCLGLHAISYFGHEGDGGVSLHVFFGEAHVNVHNHLSADSLHGRGCHGEVFCAQRGEFAARGKQHGACERSRKGQFRVGHILY